jgi:TusA-related sulfurtransferase
LADTERVVRIEIDNRGLTLPEPMERVISALQTLRDEDELVALLDREPLLLFPELERRG